MDSQSRRTACSAGVLFILLVLPAREAVVRAQSSTTGAIAGEVTDSTGGVLPGVTVEAASPALIEGVRSAVTDGQGQYKVVDLRPGSYTVTFTLPGFATVVREGLELNAGFTATVDAELSVGSIEEAITVSGASPVVDVQNVRSQNLITREFLDAVPNAKNFQALAALTLGASATSLGAGDVGGNKGETIVALDLHGARGGLKYVDGMRTNSGFQVADVHRYMYNTLAVEELVLETGGIGAEGQSGGLNVNMVPKDGGNIFSGSFLAEYTGRDLVGSNLTDELRSRGLTRVNTVDKIYDVGVGLGGPIKSDELWFFTAFRSWGAVEESANVFFNATQDTLFYTPDLTRPSFRDNYTKDASLRLTWQANENHKITASGSLQDFCYCYFTTGLAIPEATYHYHLYPQNLFQTKWTYPATSRLLVEAGWYLRVDSHLAEKPPETGNARAVRDLSRGITYGSLFSTNLVTRQNYGDHGSQGAWGTRLSVSYVPGSHAFKFGLETMSGQSEVAGEPNFPVQYLLRNDRPVGITQIATPHHHVSKLGLDLGLFAQDQWTIRNLTLNLGLRFDYLNSYNPAQTRPGGEFLGPIDFPEVRDVPKWKDLSPRVGVAYDLFGNGKTAFKTSLGRYMSVETVQIASRTNPATAIAGSTTRTWNDDNSDFVVDCDLRSRTENGECGPIDNQAFGTPIRITDYSEDVTEGWGVRPYHWRVSAVLEHELRPGVSVRAGYYRTWFGNFQVTDNRAVTADDFDPYCITAPMDSRLPGGGGYEVCGLYDVTPEKFGLVDNVIRLASDFGDQSSVYNGVEFGVDARFGQGGVVSGGVSFGRKVTDECAVPDAPAQFCRTTIPFAADTQVKLSGRYPLPWDVWASATFQNLSGLPPVRQGRAADYTATNAEIAPSLGRNLASCGTRDPCTAAVVVQIMEPYSKLESRYTQLDVRFSKSIEVGRVRMEPRLDVYNLLNSSSILQQNTRFGSSFWNPREILGARMVKFGAQIDF